MEIIDLLRMATEQGNLQWEKTPDPYEFKGKFSGGGVRIRALADSWIEGGAIISKNPPTGPADQIRPMRFGLGVLTLLDQTGQIIEEWRTVSQEESVAFEALFQNVRGKALRIKQRIDEVLTHLRTITASTAS